MCVSLSLVSGRSEEDLAMRCALLGRIVQSGQDPVHAAGIRCDGQASAGVSQLTAATDLVGHLVASTIAGGNVRLDGSVEHLLAGLDISPVDRIEDRETLLRTRDLAAEGGNWIGDETWTRNERHLLPVNFVSLQWGSFLRMMDSVCGCDVV